MPTVGSILSRFRAVRSRALAPGVLIGVFLSSPAFSQSLFGGAIMTKHSIDLLGNGVYTDSYDSSDPTKSINGTYNSAWYSGDKGDIICNGGILDSVNVGNADIYGHIHTGINCPVSIGFNGGVGAHAWLAANVGFEPGWVVQDANFT